MALRQTGETRLANNAEKQVVVRVSDFLSEPTSRQKSRNFKWDESRRHATQSSGAFVMLEMAPKLLALSFIVEHSSAWLDKLKVRDSPSL